MFRQLLWLAALTASTVNSQSTTSSNNPSAAVLIGTSTSASAITRFTDTDTGIPTGSQFTYQSYNTTRILSSTTTRPANGTNITTTVSGASAAQTLTFLGGTNTATGNATATTTSTGAVNTQPCNGHTEFCNRKYSNITMVAAHNFCFVKPGNAASNQYFGVLDQLNDGVRMLQGETYDNNGTMTFCHSSCDLLNAGTLADQFTTVATWLDAHPYDVITILLGNSDVVKPTRYVDAFEKSGLSKYVYTPSQRPMTLDAWPTLSQMILSQKRVVVFLDYEANQDTVPYILDEFSQMWETPFSPVDYAFPCSSQRPPNLSPADAQQRLYMANHNLNTNVNLLGFNILVPNTAQINETNAVSGNFSLGTMARTCTNDWNRPPNFLLVDYYNYGNFPGSVFQVAADYNGVTYTGKSTCCGAGGTTSSAPPSAALNALNPFFILAALCVAVLRF